LMMARKKKHFWFFVIPKFWKLNEYIVDRAVCLIHCYSPDMVKRGYFVYFMKDSKDFLYEKFKKKISKSYKTGWNFRGTFVKKGFVIDDKEYDRKKDEAIAAIFKDDEPKIDFKAKKTKEQLKITIKRLAKHECRTEKNICEELGINYGTYSHIGGVVPI